MFSPRVPEDREVYVGPWLRPSPELLRPVCMKAERSDGRNRDVQQHESMHAAPCMHDKDDMS